MAGVSPTDLHELAADLLAACVSALDTVPTYAPALGGAPERSFVAPGQPVFDFNSSGAGSEWCDQLTVHVGNIAEGATAGAVGNINRVQLFVTLARCCFPTVDSRGNAPSAAAQASMAEQVDADKWALWNHLHALVHEGLLFETCCDVIWGTLQPLTPSGGCGGSTLIVTVCFDGYEPVLGT